MRLVVSWSILIILISLSSFANDGLFTFNKNISNFPIIKFDTYNVKNNINSSISKGEIEIYENGSLINDYTVKKINDTISSKNLYVFALDLSNSVNVSKISYYKQFILRFLSNIDLQNNRFAIIGFNSYTFNIVSSDTSLSTINRVFDNLSTFGNANYDSLFASEFNVLSYNKLSNEVYQIILLNDGNGIVSEDVIDKRLLNNSCKLFSLSLNSDNLLPIKNAVNNLNGLYFDNINNIELVNYYADIISYYSQGIRPTEISYLSTTCQIDNDVDIINNSSASKDNFEFHIDYTKLPYIENVGSNSADFGVVSNPSTANMVFKIRAVNRDIIVQNILDDPIFKISGISKNQILKQNVIYDINVKYIPLDTNYIYRKLQIISNSCQNTALFVSGGNFNKNNSPKNLAVQQPNGGEKINVNENYNIKWAGILPKDTVSIEFSHNNGMDWELITNKATDLNYNWSNIPKINTNQGLIRIRSYSRKNEYQNIKSLVGINGKIIGLKWSKLANQLYTGSKDGFIRIWNTEKAEPIRTILNGINNLNAFDISFDEKFIFILDNNLKSLKVFNLQTSDLLKEYTFASNILSFSCDITNYNFVVSTDDNITYIYNYPNDTPIFEKHFDNVKLSIVKLSPLGNKLAIGTKEGNVYIYNINGQLISQFKNSDAEVIDIDWNKSNSIIAVSSSIETIKIWDTELGVNVLHLIESGKPIIKTLWSPNLQYIITINPNKKINIWLPSDGSLYYSFNLHTDPISDLAWNSDGTMIASGTINGEVLIWSILDIPFDKMLLQEAISDSVFSLILPSINANDVFLGQHTVGRSFDTTITNFITNSGTIDITIDSIRIWGDNSDNFLINNSFPALLRPGEILDMNLTFTPKLEKLYNNSIIIFSQNANYKKIINCNSIQNRISIEPENINFNNIKLGSKSDYIKFSIKNLTKSTISLEDFKIDTTSGFNIEDLSNITLGPLDRYVFYSYFEPKNIGEVSAINHFKFSDINDNYYLIFNGNGIAPLIEIPNNIELPNIYCDGDTLSYDLYIKNIGNDSLKIDSIYLSSTNNDFLLDLDNFNKYIKPYDSSKVVVRFSRKTQGFSSGNIVIKSNLNANRKNEFIIALLGHKESIQIETQKNNISVFANINESKTLVNKVYNKSTIPIFITPKFDNNYFSVVNNVPILILPSDSSSIEVKLNNINQAGIYKSIMTFGDICGNNYKIDYNAYIGLKNAKIAVTGLIDFDTLICHSVSAPQNIIITNIGEAPLVISDIRFLNTSVDNFAISKNISKNILEKNEKDTISIYVDAVELGNIESELLIYSNAENTNDGYNSSKLKGFISYSSAKPNSDTLYFNDLYENIMYHQSINVTNNGNTLLNWKYPIISDYFVVDSIVPKNTAPNSSSKFYITFLGGKSNNSYSYNLYFNNICDKQQKIVFYANVSKKSALGIRAGVINSAPGDTINLPIFLYLKESKTFPNVDYYECELKVNGTLLIPIDYPSSIDENYIRTIKIKLNSLPNDSGIVGNIRFLSYLGNADSTIIEIKNSKAIGDDNLVIEEVNGLFYLDSICYAGGVARLIGSTGILRLYQNYPNPAQNSTSIKFSIIEKGNYQLDIYDILSNNVRTIDLGQLKYGTYEVQLDLSNYSIGNYFYLLSTPSTKLIKKMTINR